MSRGRTGVKKEKTEEEEEGTRQGSKTRRDLGGAWQCMKCLIMTRWGKYGGRVEGREGGLN